MKPAPDHDRLLDDVLAESAAGDFRAGLLGETLRLARRRRYTRHAVRASIAAAMAVVVGLAVWRAAPRGPTLVAPVAMHCEVVRTQLFVGAPVARAAGAFVVVSTADNVREVRLLNDDELLAVASQPAALVRVGAHEQELIFVAPADREPSPLH